MDGSRAHLVNDQARKRRVFGIWIAVSSMRKWASAKEDLVGLYDPDETDAQQAQS